MLLKSINYRVDEKNNLFVGQFSFVRLHQMLQIYFKIIAEFVDVNRHADDTELM